MTTHVVLNYCASIILLCWVIALVGYVPSVARRTRFPFGKVAFVTGWLLVLGYLIWLWIMLERPPLRTTGETRLWYTAFLPAVSLLIEWRWRTRIMAIPSLLMAAVFLCITLAHPEAMDRALMPALDSPWFIPHVMAYMIAYAMLGMAAAVAGWACWRAWGDPQFALAETVGNVRRLILIAFPLLTIGMVLGAYWAQIAWGHFWTWDPKETWALMTWVCYLAYIHMDSRLNISSRNRLLLAVVAFVIVLGCWFGVNILPNAQMSVHTYSQ